jgi:hypothetical protein
VFQVKFGPFNPMRSELDSMVAFNRDLSFVRARRHPALRLLARKSIGHIPNTSFPSPNPVSGHLGSVESLDTICLWLPELAWDPMRSLPLLDRVVWARCFVLRTPA